MRLDDRQFQPSSVVASRTDCRVDADRVSCRANRSPSILDTRRNHQRGLLLFLLGSMQDYRAADSTTGTTGQRDG